MPLISTGTMGSNKSFGFSRGRLKVLTTFNFPAGTSTWTAPAGVTSLTSAVGKGANGTANSWGATLFQVETRRLTGTGTGSATLSAATITSELNTLVSVVNGMTTSESGASFFGPYYIRYIFRITSGVWTARSVFNNSGTYRRTAAASIVQNHPISGDIPSSTNIASYVNGAEVLTVGSSGTATTGFSLTLPGGTPSVPTATNTTFNDVTVSPGTTYTITNNGSLTITYYV